MGEVYLAYDSKCQRNVALKLLPAEFAKDRDRLRRFEQEAFATLALDDHHYFINIYEVGQINAIPFLAMELVEGLTLRQRLNSSRLTLADALNITTQIAEAIRVAHEAGIVHRDIKPENIMLRDDGSIKVLDLGLAKLTDALLHRIATPDALTVTNIHTGQDVVIGTVKYMSPEQLRGISVDERTDLWSLGLVVYEMLTGTFPFQGRSTGEMIVSILEREPIPLPQSKLEMTAPLQSILDRLMQKDREQRYHTAQEFLDDIREVSHSSKRKEIQDSQPLDDAREQAVVASVSQPGAVKTVPAGRHTASPIHHEEAQSSALMQKAGRSILPIHAPEAKSRQRSAATILFLLLFILGVGFLGYRALTDSRPVATSQSMQFTRLEMPGEVRVAAVSPGNKYVAVILEDAGKQSLVVKELAASGFKQLVSPSADQYTGLTFSPDERYIYYLKKEQETGTLFRTPIDGGTIDKIITSINTPVTFSPDGRRFAFVRYDKSEESSVLMVANEDGMGEQRVSTRKRPEFFTLGGSQGSGPAWSPDGNVIACPTLNMSEQFYGNIWTVNLTDGAEKRINTTRWSSIGQIDWLADGSGLVMNASDAEISPEQIWFISYPDGEARRITNDPNSYASVSVSRNSKSLVTVKSEQISTIWLLSANNLKSARQLPNSKYKGSNGISWAPNQKLIYTSNESDGQDLWLMEADGRNQRLLTPGAGADIQPAGSPDGRYFVYVSYQQNGAHIWRIDAAGTNPKQLTFGPYEDSPQFSPDGRWVIYHSIASGKDSIWKVSVDGGTPELLSREVSLHPVVSPDGKWIASFSRGEQPSETWRIALIPFIGGAPVKWFNVPAAVDVTLPNLRWTPGGRAITYVATTEGVSNVWQQQLDESPPAQLTDFKEDLIFSFAWSADGTQLVCVRGLRTSEVVMLDGFR